VKFQQDALPEYKSPKHKLLRFFEKSRDSWKEKYHEKTYENKILKNKIARIDQYKETWKQRALEAEKQIKELEAVLKTKTSVAELQSLEKKRK
jgi:hypothetical protein